ncbi:MAG: nickel pincer cofactor biosynthesis protein LarB [Planctomycetaceae bacterium]
MANSIEQLLEQVQQGAISVYDAQHQLQNVLPPITMKTSDAHVDLNRRERCGFPEVVYCEGKSTTALVEIFSSLIQHGEDAFGTRISPEQAEVVKTEFPTAFHNETARTIRIPQNDTANRPPCGMVAVVSAGTSDRPIAEEALETLHWMGCATELILDVGVAGPHRLPEHLERIRNADAVIVVAGMEGALPSVVGGWVGCPVIAVPTSVGYGASFGGLTALLGMLNSCASNVTVVNIDAGFKGGYVAGLIAHRRNSKSET